jgi:drug/metabolite transporter (DMT)-like permease
MSTQTTTPRDTTGPQMSEPRLLLALTGGLLAALILNLAVFDDLRTDGSADVAGTFLAPQHLTSILAGLLAVVLLALRHRWARRVALTVAWIEIVAFLFFHGIPFEIGPSKPYWGDGTGDALQWLGFALILACSASVVRVARTRVSDAMRPLAA